ncbi:hypothetical protein Gotur_033759, partial [Gossypium turneri]
MFEIEKFDGESNFNLWQVRMMAILVQTRLKKVITGKKPENLNQTEREELDEKALLAIQLCLANTVLQEVLMEKTSSALREKCMTVSLKIDSFLDTGFEKLGHCLYKNQTGLVLIWQCTSRRLEVFQLLSTYSTQLIPYIVHD